MVAWCAGFWWIFPILFLLMILGCVFMMRRCSCMPSWRASGGFGSRSSNDAMEILKKRYALGEIDRKQYEEMKKKIAER